VEKGKERRKRSPRGAKKAAGKPCGPRL